MLSPPLQRLQESKMTSIIPLENIPRVSPFTGLQRITREARSRREVIMIPGHLNLGNMNGKNLTSSKSSGKNFNSNYENFDAN